MWPFTTSKSTVKFVNEKAFRSETELASVVATQGIEAGIQHAIDSMIKSVDNFEYYERFDDQGNFFGTEFDIRNTAGRIKGLYSREPWVYTTASIIARTLSTLPFVVKNTNNDEINTTHPLNEKLEASNKIQDNKSMNWSGYLDLCLGGNYFLVFDEKYKQCQHVPVEYVSIDPNYGEVGIKSITLWNTWDSGATKKTVIPYDQVIHFKFPNPFNPYYGLSMYAAAARPILLDRFKNEFEMGFYLRGATNSGVIETTEDLGQTRLERLMRTFENIYTGKRNWWRTIFLPKGAKWVSAGLSMTEMQHLEGLRENRLTLLAVLGIPASKVGIVQDVNRATSEEQTKTFWENTIKPLANFLASGWNNSYLVREIYKGKVYIEPDFSQIEELQGSLIEKGNQAKAVENYWTINEIRQDIFGRDAVEGYDKLVIEINKPDSMAGVLGLQVSSESQSIESHSQAQLPTTSDDIKNDKDKSDFNMLKKEAEEGQERLEDKLSKVYVTGYEKYIDYLLTQVEKVLKDNKDPQVILNVANVKEDRAQVYMKATGESLLSALDRGFSFANSTAKNLSPRFVSRKGKVSDKRLRFTGVDQQAIDALKAEQEDGKREALLRLSLERFQGMDETRSKEVLDLIANGLEEGLTFDKIASNIRAQYNENYKNQAFTITRTEILTAISQGIKWNHDVLTEVYSEVQKQWLHVGDVGINPGARENHYGFEQEGAQDSKYKWGGILEYPRDPAGGADEVINCRCSMVSVIPDHATSNAEIILDQLL